ncbi:hypothetical protein DFH06DRAFT_1472346 [Mycena polygramma]|nr:hypothetical protein DFH06DRAFT_1472346 [Mycena polygramma]
MSFELPPELWLKIFENLAFESVLKIHPVSLMFSDLSRSFLFEEFNFYPTTFAALKAPKPEFERLAFWSSERISRHVRRCTVNLSATELCIPLPSNKGHRVPTSPLVAACIQAVSRFTNLRALSLRLCEGACLAIAAFPLGSLPQLKALHVHGARLARPTSSIRLQVEYFSYTNIPRPMVEWETLVPHSFLSPFDPRSLHHLCLASEEMTGIERFLDDKRAMVAFRNLYSLELIFNTTSIAKLHACISPFPAIRELTLKSSSPCSVEDPPPSTPIAPHLRTFNGPPDLIPAILRGTDIGNITISRDFKFAGDVLRALQTADGAARISSVVSLTMQAKYPELSQSPVLREVLTFFPHLRSLRLAVFWPASGLNSIPTGSAAQAAALAAVLRVTPLLEELVVEWWFEGGYADEVVPSIGRSYWREIIPRLEDLRDALPSLKRVSYANDARPA